MFSMKLLATPLVERAAALPIGLATSPAIRQLYEYWLRKSAGDTLPHRRDIDPVDIPHLLPSIYLVDVRAGGTQFSYRLVGQAVEDMIGHPLKGRSPEELPARDHGDLVAGHYRAVAADRTPTLHQIEFMSAERRYWHYERILLPLSEDGVTVNILLGCIARLGNAESIAAE